MIAALCAHNEFAVLAVTVLDRSTTHLGYLCWPTLCRCIFKDSYIRTCTASLDLLHVFSFGWVASHHRRFRALRNSHLHAHYAYEFIAEIVFNRSTGHPAFAESMLFHCPIMQD